MIIEGMFLKKYFDVNRVIFGMKLFKHIFLDVKFEIALRNEKLNQRVKRILIQAIF